jgi:methionine-rich copper-binding protein CopC
MRQGPASAPRSLLGELGRLVLLAIVAAVAACSVALGGAQRVHAHTDVAFTLPAADETVAEPVSTITVAFADPVTLVGAGFEVFTPQEQIVQPTVVTDDDTEFLLQLDPPLAGGVVGVRYEVVAADGHIIDGSFTFTVSAPPPTIPPATTAPPMTVPTTVPTTAAPPTTSAPTVTSAPTATSAPLTTVPPTTSEPAVIAPTPSTVVEAGGDTGGGSTGLVIGVALAAVVAIGAFVVLRTRLRTPA